MKLLLVLVLCMCFSVPVSAQKHIKIGRAALKTVSAETAGPSFQKGAFHNFKKLRTAAQKLPKTPRTPNTAALARQAQAARLALRPQEEHKKHLFTAVTEFDPDIRFSGTVFETEYNGKKEIYGVVATHILSKDDNDLFGIPRRFKAAVYLPEDPTPRRVNAEVVAVSPTSMLDISLVKFSKNGEKLFTPYKLGRISHEKTLHSASYTHWGFYFFQRRILQQTPYSIRTSMPVEHAERPGMCGSAVLNDNGELVGIHTGSTSAGVNLDGTQTDISFVTPSGFLPLLVAAHHNPASAKTPFYIDDKRSIDLDADEYIVFFYLLDENLQFLAAEPVRFRVSHSRLQNMLRQFPQAKFLHLTTRRLEWSASGMSLHENLHLSDDVPERIYLYDLAEEKLVSVTDEP